MRDAEHNAAVRALLERIAVGVERVADACERAERWTTTGAAPVEPVTPENALAVLLEPDPLAASTEAECGPLGGTAGRKRKRGKRG